MPRPKSKAFDASSVMQSIIGGGEQSVPVDSAVAEGPHTPAAAQQGTPKPAAPARVVKRSYYLSPSVVEALRVKAFYEPELTISGHVEKALMAYLRMPLADCGDAKD